MGELARWVRDALDGRGLEAADEDVERAAALARLLVQAVEGRPSHAVRARIAAAVRRETSLDTEAAAMVAEVASAPRFRETVRPEELRVYAAWFGRDAAEALLSEEAGETTLAEYAARHGPRAALRLLRDLADVVDAGTMRRRRRILELVEAGEALGIDPAVVSTVLDERLSLDWWRWPLKGERITIGRGRGNDVVLPDPRVGHHHATLVRTGGGWRLVVGTAGRPVLLGTEPVRSAPLEPGAGFRVGPVSLRLADGWLERDPPQGLDALAVRGLVRDIGDVRVLDDVSFTVFSGEVVALVGPSGAGKTTLINAISGVHPADAGGVTFRGRPFQEILLRDRSAVGLVPQEDLVHAELTVEESLRFAGRLRLGGRATDEELERRCDRVLETLGIAHIRRSRIGDAIRRGISGGQRKRVNLAQELLSPTTRILFLDEPTSGLDPRSAQDIARLVRRLADDGRIVFLVTHDLSPGIMAQVDHLLVMAPGGRLAWFGPPDEACAWFGVESPDLVFDVLGRRPPEEWAAAWREDPASRLRVEGREIEAPDAPAEAASPVRRSPLRQFATLTARYALARWRDRTGMAVLLAQGPLLALMMAIVFPVLTARTLFMLSLACLWFGMSASVRELIADRAIWRRERRVGVGVTPYVLSKVVVLGLIVSLQCGLLTVLVHHALDMGELGFPLGRLVGISALIGFCGAMLGLAVSALYTSSEAAVGMLPLLLIPQICFSSIMVPLRHMGTLSRALTWVTVERYAFDAVIKAGREVYKVARGDGNWATQPIRGTLYELGLKSVDAEDMGLEMPLLVAALGGFSLLFLAVAWGATWWRDR